MRAVPQPARPRRVPATSLIPSAMGSDSLEWSGLVLCGGESRRMGTDKATMGEPPWATRVARALAGAGCEPVTLVGGGADVAALGWDHVADTRPGAGPASALADRAAAMAAGAAGRGLMVAACDLPGLQHSDVRALMREVANGSPVAAYTVEDRPQWSLVAMGPHGVAEIAAADTAAGASMHALLGHLLHPVTPEVPERVRDIDSPFDGPPTP